MNSEKTSLGLTGNSIPKQILLPSVDGPMKKCLQELFGRILVCFWDFKQRQTNSLQDCHKRIPWNTPPNPLFRNQVLEPL